RGRAAAWRASAGAPRGGDRFLQYFRCRPWRAPPEYCPGETYSGLLGSRLNRDCFRNTLAGYVRRGRGGRLALAGHAFLAPDPPGLRLFRQVAVGAALIEPLLAGRANPLAAE